MCNIVTAGHSEGEYFGTPEGSPAEHPTSNPGRGERQAHDSSEARRELNLTAPVKGSASQDRHVQGTLSSAQHSSDTNRDMANNDSFQTARSHASDDAHTDGTGIVRSVLEAAGLASRDHVEGSGGHQSAPDATTHSAVDNNNTTTTTSNTGALGSIKAAVGLGDNNTSGSTHSTQEGTGYDSSYTGSGNQGYGSGAGNQGSNTSSGLICTVSLLVRRSTSRQAMMGCTSTEKLCHDCCSFNWAMFCQCSVSVMCCRLLPATTACSKASLMCYEYYDLLSAAHAVSCMAARCN